VSRAIVSDLALNVCNALREKLIFNIDLAKAKSRASGLGPMKLTHDEREFRFQFCNFVTL